VVFGGGSLLATRIRGSSPHSTYIAKSEPNLLNRVSTTLTM
jgi:hypothetical protein